jgi:hypothetical protein
VAVVAVQLAAQRQALLVAALVVLVEAGAEQQTVMMLHMAVLVVLVVAVAVRKFLAPHHMVGRVVLVVAVVGRNLRQVTLLVVRAVTEEAVAVRIETVVGRQLLVVKAATEPYFFIGPRATNHGFHNQRIYWPNTGNYFHGRRLGPVRAAGKRLDQNDRKCFGRVYSYAGRG